MRCLAVGDADTDYHDHQHECDRVQTSRRHLYDHGGALFEDNDSAVEFTNLLYRLAQPQI